MSAVTKAQALKAAEIVEAGWTQGGFVAEKDGRLCYCGEGAIAAALGAEARRYQGGWRLGYIPGMPHVAWDDLAAFVSEQTSGDCADMAGYNDTPGRTAAEVAAMLRLFAETLPE